VTGDTAARILDVNSHILANRDGVGDQPVRMRETKVQGQTLEHERTLLCPLVGTEYRLEPWPQVGVAGLLTRMG
jgi:hypothetical protein